MPFMRSTEACYINKTYVEKLKAELADTMAMCGAHSLADISRSMLYGF